jgi:hypothetical protein
MPADAPERLIDLAELAVVDRDGKYRRRNRRASDPPGRRAKLDSTQHAIAHRERHHRGQQLRERADVRQLRESSDRKQRNPLAIVS